MAVPSVAGGAAIVDFELQVPGTLILVDHALLRAFNKGALAMLKVEGAPVPLVYFGQEVDEVYLGDAAPKAQEARVADPAESRGSRRSWRPP